MKSSESKGTTNDGNKITMFKGAEGIYFAGGSLSTHTATYEFIGNPKTQVEDIPVPQGEISMFEQSREIIFGKDTKVEQGQLKVTQTSTEDALVLRQPAGLRVGTRVPKNNLTSQSIPKTERLALPPPGATMAQPTRMKSGMKHISSSEARKAAWK